jgi:dipeptidase E
VRTIFAMGGGGFTMEPGNPLLDELILGLARRPVPRICFLPTASGDPFEHVARFYEAFSDRPCECSDLSLFRLGRRPADLRATLLAQDIVYVGGGSMRNMLAIWRVHELDAILRECWMRGVVLAGLSAGAMCWFEAGVTKSRGTAEPVAGLGFLRGSLSVHHDSEPERRPVHLASVAAGALPDGFGADDGVGLLFRDERLVRVVGSRPGARCVRVRRDGRRAVEEPLPVEHLGDGQAVTTIDPDVRELRAMRRGRGGGGAECRRSVSR